jgi:nucleotide-binding universal stress UspA family protein
MSTTYIAGYDGSDASRAALRFVTQLGSAAGDEVIAAMVYQQSVRGFGKTAPGGPVVALDEQSRADAEQVLVAGGVPDVMRCVVGAGSPAEGLHRLAGAQRAALLAVGVTHHGSLGRLMPGSVGEHLLHGAPCPVAVVPADFKEGPLRTVAVAYDEREESKVALRVGEDLARRLGARLLVIAVCDASMTHAELLGQLEERMRQDIQQDVDALASDVDTDVRVLTGPAARTLVGACQNEVDLLVTGSRGYGPARGVLLGSVSRYLIDHAPCPVIVVPRAASAAVLAEPATAKA